MSVFMLVFYIRGVSITTIDFNSEALCLEGKKRIYASYADYASQVSIACVER